MFLILGLLRAFTETIMTRCLYAQASALVRVPHLKLTEASTETITPLSFAAQAAASVRAPHFRLTEGN